MEDIVTRKFTQNPDLRKRLLDTGNYTLYEATSNQFWGCGLRLNSRLWTSGMIPGKNYVSYLDASEGGNEGLLRTTRFKETFNCYKCFTLTEKTTTSVEQMETGPATDGGHLNPTPMSTTISSADQAHIHEAVMGTQESMESSDNVNSSQNTSSIGEENSSFRDFAMNSEFDICKVNAWKLTKVKRGTKEWDDKEKARGLLKWRNLDRHDESDSQPRHSTPNHNTPSHNRPPYRKRPTRNFRNSSYQEKLLKVHGYDIETGYQKAMASYNESHVTDRKGQKK